MDMQASSVITLPTKGWLAASTGRLSVSKITNVLNVALKSNTARSSSFLSSCDLQIRRACMTSKCLTGQSRSRRCCVRPPRCRWLRGCQTAKTKSCFRFSRSFGFGKIQSHTQHREDHGLPSERSEVILGLTIWISIGPM